MWRAFKAVTAALAVFGGTRAEQDCRQDPRKWTLQTCNSNFPETKYADACFVLAVADQVSKDMENQFGIKVSVECLKTACAGEYQCVVEPSKYMLEAEEADLPCEQYDIPQDRVKAIAAKIQDMLKSAESMGACLHGYVNRMYDAFFVTMATAGAIDVPKVGLTVTADNGSKRLVDAKVCPGSRDAATSVYAGVTARTNTTGNLTVSPA